jgi:hypothetical protein
MAHDLVAMGISADKSGGAALYQMPILVGETHYPGNGVPGTGTFIYPKTNSIIFGHFTGDETAAAVEYRLHKTSDPDWMRTYNTRLQTTPFAHAVNRCFYPINVGDSIEAQLTNGGAVFNGLGILIAKKAGDEIYDINVPRAGWLRPGDRIVRATSTFTHVADAWAEGTITWNNFTPKRDKKYQIVGMCAHSATGWATRIRHVTGPNVDDRPGVPLGDTGGTVPQHVMIFADFGTFDGMNPPLVQSSTVSGADATTELTFIIREL